MLTLLGAPRRVLSLVVVCLVVLAACSGSDDVGDAPEVVDTPAGVEQDVSVDGSVADADGGPSAEQPDGAGRTVGDSDSTPATQAPRDTSTVDNPPVDDGVVYEDTEGVYADASLSDVLIDCASASTPAACGSLGDRLVEAGDIEAAESEAAVCVAAGLLSGDDAERFAGAIALTFLFGSTDDTGVTAALDQLRAGDTSDPQFDSAASTVITALGDRCP